jgi:hypothetical protein
VPRSVITVADDTATHNNLPDCLRDLPDLCPDKQECKKLARAKEPLIPLPDLVPEGGSWRPTDCADHSPDEKGPTELAAAITPTPVVSVEESSQTSPVNVAGLSRTLKAATGAKHSRPPPPVLTARARGLDKPSLDCLLARADQEVTRELWQAAGCGLQRIADRFAAERGAGGRLGGQPAGRGRDHWGGAEADSLLPALAVSLFTKIALCVVVKKIYNVLY